jgi:hypothetical protein
MGTGQMLAQLSCDTFAMGTGQMLAQLSCDMSLYTTSARSPFGIGTGQMSSDSIGPVPIFPVLSEIVAMGTGQMLAQLPRILRYQSVYFDLSPASCPCDEFFLLLIRPRGEREPRETG